MCYGHHKILLLLLQPDLPTHSTENKNGRNNDKGKEKKTFTQVFDSVSFFILNDGIVFSLVKKRGTGTVNGSIKLFQFEVSQRITLFLQRNKPPGECCDYIDEHEPVNISGSSYCFPADIRHGKNYFFSIRNPAFNTFFSGSSRMICSTVNV